MKELFDNTKKEVEIKENKIEPLEYLDKDKLSKETLSLIHIYHMDMIL